MADAAWAVHGTDALDEYPISRDERIDAHWFMPLERRRWLNSSMRVLGRPECRALYWDLICISYDHTPVGTLPIDMAQLSRLAMCDERDFRDLCRLQYGPLHLWTPCLSEGEKRLMHPHVTRVVLDAVSRKHDNRARNEAGNARQRRRRLRQTLTGFDAELAGNDAAVLWIDAHLEARGARRSHEAVQAGLVAWQNHCWDKARRQSMK